LGNDDNPARDGSAPNTGEPAPAAASGESAKVDVQATPVASGMTPVALRIEPRPAAREEDTLLSAPTPADRLELLLEDRLSEFEQHLDLLASRISVLEKRRSTTPKASNPHPWVWIAFLAGLAIIWKLLIYFH
jgi:hypothetical protein